MKGLPASKPTGNLNLVGASFFRPAMSGSSSPSMLLLCSLMMSVLISSFLAYASSSAGFSGPW